MLLSRRQIRLPAKLIKNTKHPAGGPVCLRGVFFTSSFTGYCGLRPIKRPGRKALHKEERGVQTAADARLFCNAFVTGAQAQTYAFPQENGTGPSDWCKIVGVPPLTGQDKTVDSKRARIFYGG